MRLRTDWQGNAYLTVCGTVFLREDSRLRVCERIPPSR